MGCTLLDWIDGPIARKYNQCSLWGCGIDWFCDILAYTLQVFWWAHLDMKMLPILWLLVVVDTGGALYDFGASMSEEIVRIDYRKGNVFFWVLDWVMPNNSYTHFGTFTWISFPIYANAKCIELSLNAGWISEGILSNSYNVILSLKVIEYVFLLPAIINCWSEAAFFIHLMITWTETRQTIHANEKEVSHTPQPIIAISSASINSGILRQNGYLLAEKDPLLNLNLLSFPTPFVTSSSHVSKVSE